MTGRFAASLHTDTHDMLANALTKHVTLDELLHRVLATGLLQQKHPGTYRPADAQPANYDEDWLLQTTSC